MEEYSRYNQIKMHLIDEETIAFHSPKGVFYDELMPFNLKNTRATYQHATTIIFKEILGGIIEW